jgi:putative membrane protein insertion efficiency factor
MKNIQHPTSNIQHPTPMDSRVHWMFGVGCWMSDVPQSLLIFGIRVYQLTISPAQVFLFGPTGGCRFTPSCSQYAMDAVHAHGALAGSALAAKRICRCHPWSDGGHDPVPENGKRKAESGMVLGSIH